MVRVNPILGQEGSSKQRSLVNSRRTPLQDGQVPPRVHPFGITIDEQGLSGDPGFDKFSKSPSATCPWPIAALGFGQKQHYSPEEHLQSSLRCSWGQRWVHATALSVSNKLAHNTNANASKIWFMLDFGAQFCFCGLTLTRQVNQFTKRSYMQVITYTRKDPHSCHLHFCW